MSDPQEVAAGPLPPRLIVEFEQLGLSPYEARVLLALMRLGSANTAHLARVAQVPRTSTYQILEELNVKGLAQRVSVRGPAIWATPARSEVFDRIDANEEERLRDHRRRTLRLRELVEEQLPDESIGAGPYVHVVQGAHQVSSIYERIVGQAREELLVFNRPPYSEGAEQVSPAVMSALRQGLTSKVLYERAQWEHENSAGFREAMAVYHRAGVEARLVDDLPLKLAIVDRKVALLAMADPVLPEIGFPTTLLVEHPGYAALQADAFEARWSTATPVETPTEPQEERQRESRYAEARNDRWAGGRLQP